MPKNDYPFHFQPRSCATCGGKCCRGPSGYIWATLDEQEALAHHFSLSLQEFQRKYIERVDSKYSFIETEVGKDDYACVFFDLNTQQCSIYELRPKQCRTYPFWSFFKKFPELVIKECPGTQPLED